ncbi:restriction endonuclease [Enemella evansiae]|uniref:restriction endonuclease n=1 Tax=Enemella evansiae TaxID=2016499 RepID=UPI0015C611C4|nr:restriction endonuclease [Enemella evansiae]
MAHLIIDEGLASSLDIAFEIAETVLPAVRVMMSRFQADAESEGTAWRVELYGSGEEWIRGASFADMSLEASVQKVRANRAHVSEVKAELVSLDPSEFERGCTTILKALGCDEPHTSPIRDDGGIDFYGQLKLKGRLDAGLPLGGVDARANVWLLGQAKHYPTRPIQTAALRELVGSVELARTGGAIHTWEGLTLNPFDASLMLMFSTGHFTSGSRTLLAQTGILAMNGEQLATFLCDVGLGFDSADNSFDATEFRRRLLDST